MRAHPDPVSGDGPRRDGIARRAGLMLHVAESGSGEAITFLHGFALDGRMWGPQISALAGAYRTLAIDLPGFGRSRYIEGHTPMTGEILSVLDARGVDRTHVVGLSLGGAVATDFALMHGDRVRSLVLADALLLGYPAVIPTWERAVELAKRGERAAALEHWLSDPVFDVARTRPPVWARIREIIATYDAGHWAGTSKLRWAITKPRERLGDLRVPTLVIVGEHDTPSFQAMADEYAGAIPGARKITISGAGHASSLEEPEAFTRALRDFFSQPGR
jgi:pimeloyl-ACP methyl ester carboxylesterase